MRRVVPILLAASLAAGCTYHRTLFSPLRPEDAPGNGEVVHRFTIIRARSVPFFYDHEWDLSLAIPLSQVRAGNQISFPSGEVQAVFSEWHHPNRVMAIPTGTIRFTQVLSDAVQAEVDMRADVPSHWKIRRILWFRYDPLAATEMPWVRPDSAEDDES